MKRRGFVKSLTMATGFLSFSILPFFMGRLMRPNVKASASNRIPLPGALKNQDDFIHSCIGCGLCGEVCPPRCIQFHKHDGGFLADTPYIDPEQKGCILCGLCMEVCPTDSLTITPIREVNMGIAQIDRAACYPWVDAGICGACVSICPLGDSAIDFKFANFYRPVVKDGCVGCGQCVEVCPEPSLPINIVARSHGTVAQHGIGIRKLERGQRGF